MPTETPFGRRLELAALDQVLADLADGRGRTVWLAGEAGIGKSTLLDALGAAAAKRRFTVFRASGDELLQPFPLRLMANCLAVSHRSPDEDLRGVAALLRGEQRPADAIDPVLIAAERLLEFVDRAAVNGPMVVMVEDLQWADEPSLSVWQRLGRATDQIPLLLVGTSRPVPARPEVTRLRAVVEQRRGVVLELGLLDEAAVLAIARDRLYARPGPALSAWLRRASGNPLYVRELLAALVDEGCLVIADGMADLPPDVDELPSALTAAIGRRLGFLDPAVRELLRVAALLGNNFAVHELATALDRPVSTLLGPFEQALAAGVLADTGDRLTFRHGLIREVLAAEISPSLRASLHGQYAHRLAEAGAGIAVVARHLLATSTTMDSWGVRWLTDLPEPVLSTAPQVAVQLLTRAIGSPAGMGQRRAALVARLAMTLFWLGQDAAVIDAATDAVGLVDDPDLRARMRFYQVRSASRAGRLEVADAAATAAAKDTQLPGAWRARVGGWHAIVLFKAGRVAHSVEVARNALRDGVAHADALAIASAHHALSKQVDEPTSLTHIQAGLAALGDGPESMELRSLLLNNLLARFNNLGRREEFRTAAAQALVLAGRTGFRAVQVHSAVAMGCYDFGDWDDALLQLDSIPAIHLGMAIVREGLAALIHVRREDRAAADRHIAAGLTVPVTPGDVSVLSGYLSAARAARAETDGDRALAVRLLAGWLTPGLDASGRAERCMWLPDLVRLALANGDRATAGAATAAAVKDADGTSLRHALAARACQAQYDDDAAELLRVAGEYRRHGWSVAQASCLEEAAVRLAAVDDAAAARAALSSAVRGYAGFGATRDIRRADARLRAHGIRRGPRSLGRRPRTGWEALTPAELRVVDLVAQGRPNPDIASELFLSRRTVQTHVSNILTKLSLNSRLEIMREATRR